MSKTQVASKQKKDHARAEELMTRLATYEKKWTALTDTIKDELEEYRKVMDEAEAELIEIGGRNEDQFDQKGNWHFDEGYLHVQQSAVAVTNKKFDVLTFYKEKGALLDVKLRTGDIKKLWIDDASRKELQSLGVSLESKQSLKVIVNKEH